jgi:hypothetical protein
VSSTLGQYDEHYKVSETATSVASSVPPSPSAGMPTLSGVCVSPFGCSWQTYQAASSAASSGASALHEWWTGRPNPTVEACVVGCQNSGKTTLLHVFAVILYHRCLHLPSVWPSVRHCVVMTVWAMTFFFWAVMYRITQFLGTQLCRHAPHCRLQSCQNDQGEGVQPLTTIPKRWQL